MIRYSWATANIILAGNLFRRGHQTPRSSSTLSICPWCSIVSYVNFILEPKSSSVNTKHRMASDLGGDGTTEILCNWIHSLESSNIPCDVIERAKYLILDGLGCGLVGSHVPWSERCAEAIDEFEPRGDCGVIGYDRVCAALSLLYLRIPCSG